MQHPYTRNRYIVCCVFTTSSPAQPLFIYLALHNVHVPMHAPADTVYRFSHVATDARKLANAMLLEADW